MKHSLNTHFTGLFPSAFSTPFLECLRYFLAVERGLQHTTPNCRWPRSTTELPFCFTLFSFCGVRYGTQMKMSWMGLVGAKNAGHLKAISRPYFTPNQPRGVRGLCKCCWWHFAFPAANRLAATAWAKSDVVWLLRQIPQPWPAVDTTGYPHVFFCPYPDMPLVDSPRSAPMVIYKSSKDKNLALKTHCRRDDPSTCLTRERSFAYR